MKNINKRLALCVEEMLERIAAKHGMLNSLGEKWRWARKFVKIFLQYSIISIFIITDIITHIHIHIIPTSNFTLT